MAAGLAARLAAIAGDAWVATDAATRHAHGRDALGRGHAPDVVVTPGAVAEIAAIARLCHETRTPLVVRGAGTGYTGGSVPVRGGVVLSMARFARILEIDADNLLAVVQPNVITRDLHEAVEARGLFYPPDPASLAECAIGGNVAECAGGPRAFKYGTTRRYVLALEAVLPTGEIIRTGSKAVKNVAGYALTDLLVGSEGTLAVLTEVTVRLVPLPPHRRALSATYRSVDDAARAVGAVVAAGVVPAVLELIDGPSLDAVAVHLGRPMAPPGTAALLIVELDGHAAGVDEEARLAAAACRTAGATQVIEAGTARRARGAVGGAPGAVLRLASGRAAQDQPRRGGAARPRAGAVRAGRRRRAGATPCASPASVTPATATSTSTSWSIPTMPPRWPAPRRPSTSCLPASSPSRARSPASTASASPRPRTSACSWRAAEIALMARVKHAFDPHGVLNPGKMWETTPADLAGLDDRRPGPG